jgi:hypothetical protein
MRNIKLFKDVAGFIGEVGVKKTTIIIAQTSEFFRTRSLKEDFTSIQIGLSCTPCVHLISADTPG